MARKPDSVKYPPGQREKFRQHWRARLLEDIATGEGNMTVDEANRQLKEAGYDPDIKQEDVPTGTALELIIAKQQEENAY